MKEETLERVYQENCLRRSISEKMEYSIWIIKC